MRRAADGRIFVAGLDFSGASDNDGRAADWFFRQTEFVIRNGTVRWTDEMRGAPPLALDQVDFVMRNGGRRHALRLDATPPARVGRALQPARPVSPAAADRARTGAGRTGTASCTATSRASTCRSCGATPTWAWKSAKGTAPLRAWADIEHGQLAGGVADLMLADVSTTLGPQLHAAGAAIHLRAASAASGWPAASKSRPRTCSSRPAKASAGRAATCSCAGPRPRGAGRPRASCAPTSSTCSR